MIVRDTWGDSEFTGNHDVPEDLPAQVIHKLTDLGLSLATCESLTGGALGAALCSVAGASKVYRGGLITYASDLKTSLAGVDADWIQTNGVINGETASQMALGAAKQCGSATAISTTGVAGPDGQDGHQPGEVWVGVVIAGQVFTKQFCFVGGRESVRRQTVQASLWYFLQLIWEQKQFS